MKSGESHLLQIGDAADSLGNQQNDTHSWKKRLAFVN